MATLWVTEFLSVPAGGAQCATLPSIGTQTLPILNTQMALTLGPNTYLIRIYCDVNAYYDVGPSPIPNIPCSSGIPEYFTVSPNDIIAVVLR